MSVDTEGLSYLLEDEHADSGLARKLVDHLDSKLDEEPHLKDRIFGRIVAFGSELGQLHNFKELISRYVERESPGRPLCLAVFGPPGSGKSFAVEEVVDQVQKIDRENKKLKLRLHIVNLTQFAQPVELGRTLARIAGEQDKNTVPVVFFDEFDTTRNGTRFGWLSWFLAPMNDAAFQHEGATVHLERTVYVFAGGTASTIAEFAEPAALQEFRFAKGPDFVSRLRGVLEVQGPNAPPRLIRRALILRYELQKRAPEDEWKNVKVEQRLLDSILAAGRYRHGSRSLSALVEMSTFTPPFFLPENLPGPDFLALHVDRGPLDPRRIGGAIALSGKIPAPGQDAKFRECWEEIARRLWDEGATLAYAGKLEEGHLSEEDSLTAKLLNELEARPAELWQLRKKAHDAASGAEGAAQSQAADADPAAKPRLHTFALSGGVHTGDDIVKVHTVPSADRLSQGSRIRTIVEDLRRRLASTAESVARFAVGGLTAREDLPEGKGYAGRMPGIAEEVMLSLAHGHPVYVAGGLGGAAREVGLLLGLSNERSGRIPACMVDDDSVDLDRVKCELQPPPWLDLSVTATDTARFLQKHALGGELWPDNGLSREDNCRLFAREDPKEIVRLVLKGLLKCFAATNG